LHFADLRNGVSFLFLGKFCTLTVSSNALALLAAAGFMAIVGALLKNFLHRLFVIVAWIQWVSLDDEILQLRTIQELELKSQKVEVEPKVGLGACLYVRFDEVREFVEVDLGFLFEKFLNCFFHTLLHVVFVLKVGQDCYWVIQRPFHVFLIFDELTVPHDQVFPIREMQTQILDHHV
jgi:hypothetical protein